VCTPNATNTLWSHCQCILADGVERGMLAVNRMLPGPSIQVHILYIHRVAIRFSFSSRRDILLILSTVVSRGRIYRSAKETRSSSTS